MSTDSLRIPVVFCHDSRPKFLVTAIGNAESTNHEVFCISNEPEALVADPEFSIFMNLYEHLSPNSEKFERLCFYRYFALRKFLREEGLAAAFLVDSDVLILRNLGGLLREIENKGCDVALSIPDERDPILAEASPHLSFWRISTLESFIQYMLRQYECNVGELQEIVKEKKKRRIRSGISDMTLLFMWSMSVNGVFNVAVATAAGVVDHNINVKNNAEMNEYIGFCGGKRIYERNNSLYIKSRAKGRCVPLLALHFQGRSKQLMDDIANRKIARFYGKFAVLRVGTFVLRRFQAFTQRFKRLWLAGPEPATESGERPLGGAG